MGSGFDPWQRQEIILFSIISRPALRPTQPPTQWVPEEWLKRQGREIYHSPPSRAMVTNDGAIAPLPVRLPETFNYTQLRPRDNFETKISHYPKYV
jgi:hypothetical protein